MKRVIGIRPGVTLFATLWAAALPALALVLMLVHLPQAPAASPQSASPATPKSADQKSGQSSGWHHFGENQSPPSPAPLPAPAPRQSGTWRRFGQGGNAPSLPRDIPASRSPVANRVREMELQMLEMLNRDRADPANMAETNGRATPLQWNEQLAAVARAHSLDMLNQGYFAHEDRQGRSVANRIEAAGMEWRSVGENIAIYNDVARAEAAFMNEPSFTKNHRANILNAGFTEVGVGIVQARNGSLYITQDFYTPVSHPAAK